MLLLLPIPLGAEATLRRWPVGTLGLIAVNFIVALLTWGASEGPAGATSSQLERLAGWELHKASVDDPRLGERVAAYPSALAYLSGEPAWEGQIEDPEARARLTGYLAEYRQAVAGDLFHRFGFIPADIRLSGLVGHMFLHGGFLHLLFNMVFLWAVGCVLEDRWGTALFLPLYLGLGIAAAAAHAAWTPDSVEPAVGASGAVAGLMGAFAVQQARTRLRIALVYALGLVPRVRLMSVPAAVFLLAWFAEQLFWGLLDPGMKTGIAFSAHLGGFVAGALVGLALGRLNPVDGTAGQSSAAPSRSSR